MTRHSLSLVLFALGLYPTPAPAQQQMDRRSRDEPEIVVEAGGRVGPCDVLRFSPDGRFLLAGGDDKVVRVWPHSATGLDTERGRVQTLRWRAWREQRGGIKCLALAPDGTRVAVGGYGMKPSTVAILDRASGDPVALSWPKTSKGEPNFGTVTAITFAAEGRVGFGTADGSLWVWEPVKLDEPDKDGRVSRVPVRVGKFTERVRFGADRSEFNYPRLVHFADKNTLLGVSQSGQLVACDLTGKVPDAVEQAPPARELFALNAVGKVGSEVFRAELIDDGKWLLFAVLDELESYLLLLRADGKESIRLALAAGRFPRSIAWNARTRQVAVGVGRALDPGKGPRFYSEGPEEVWLFDDPLKNPKAAPKKYPHPARAEALAFHPALPHLAVAGGGADEVTLLELGDTLTPLTVARGAGRRPTAVNVSANGKVVGVRVERDAKSTDPNARGAGEWTRFDLTRLKPTLDDSQKWVNPLKEADGWVIEPTGDRFVWIARRTRDEIVLKLALDRARDQAPTCFTFLPAKGAGPTRVLVGHYYGCTLFELVPTRAENGAIAGTRVFTGHAGEVTSVVADANQEWFVTGGSDQTVAAWALGDWKSEPNLGATFRENDGFPVVVAVDAGSPAWEAGLRAGDVIDLLAVKSKLVFDRSAKVPFGTAAGALEKLKEPRPWVELYFGVAARPNAARFETLTTVRQRPLWKWFPAFDDRNVLNDWVVWMWHGSYYHTKSANGDRLVGWHVNAPDPGGRPRFYQLQQFEQTFHRPEVLEKLVRTRDAGAALVEARGPNPTIVSFTQFEPAPAGLALQSTDVPAAGLALTVAARPRGNNPDLRPERVELWLNDHLLESWPKAGQKLDPKVPFEQRVTVPANKFRAGENRLTVLSYNAAGGRSEDAQTVRNARPPGDAQLLALLAGINDYSDTRKNVAGARKFGDLGAARNDATALGDRLLSFKGPKRLYTDAKIDVRLDGEAGRKTLTADLDALALRAQPDDLLFVFFAGHGDLLMPKDGPQPPETRAALPGEGTFLFCCSNYAPATAAETAISVEELFAALAKVNCRKVVLIDACRSGRATAPNVLRRCVPNGQGPIIIAACDQSEESYEHPPYGHGLFTYSVLNALDKNKEFRKADSNSDGRLSAEELYEYVAVTVPELIQLVGKPGQRQTPICFPRQLPKAGLLK